MYQNEKSACCASAPSQYNRTATEACAPSPTATPVALCLEQLAITQGATHDLLNQLAHRLEPALRPPYPRADEAKQAVSESALCDDIVRRTDSALYMNDKLRDLLDRLTV